MGAEKWWGSPRGRLLQHYPLTTENHHPIRSQQCRLIQSDYKGWDHSHCHLITEELSHFARVLPAGVSLYCRLLQIRVTFLVWGVLTCVRGRLLLLGPFRQAAAASRLRARRFQVSFINSIFSKWLFLPLYTSASHKWASSGQITVDKSIGFQNIWEQERGLSLHATFQVFRSFFEFLLVCFFNDIQPMGSSKVTENYLGMGTMNKTGYKEADNEDMTKKIHPAIPSIP